MKYNEKYLKDIIYGGIDGTITTFAIVSGVFGASLSFGVILVLGIANLLADGFSMAVGNYLSSKSEIEKIKNKRKEYHKKVRMVPDIERDELKKNFLKKGFDEATINSMVSEISLNKEAWEKLMISEMYGEYDNIKPEKSALATFLSFVFFGSIPLSSFVVVLFFDSFKEYAMMSASIITAFTLFFIGVLKAKVVDKNPIKSGLETLIVGGFASFIAFVVGYFLRTLA